TIVQMLGSSVPMPKLLTMRLESCSHATTPPLLKRQRMSLLPHTKKSPMQSSLLKSWVLLSGKTGGVEKPHLIGSSVATRLGPFVLLHQPRISSGVMPAQLFCASSAGLVGGSVFNCGRDRIILYCLPLRSFTVTGHGMVACFPSLSGGAFCGKNKSSALRPAKLSVNGMPVP